MKVSSYLQKIAKLPFGNLDKLGGGGVIILAPHPDDEALGTGGLIAACVDAGIRVNVVVLTDGSGSHPNSRRYPKDRLVELRREECRSGLRELGLQSDGITYLELTDTAAPTSGPLFDEAVQRLSHIAQAQSCTSLFVTWDMDPHCDHFAAARMASAVARRIPDLLIWHYPIWGWYLPGSKQIPSPYPQGFRFDITPWVDRKRRAIEAHASQVTGLIDDDPEGFTFCADNLRRFMEPTEYFIRDQA